MQDAFDPAIRRAADFLADQAFNRELVRAFEDAFSEGRPKVRRERSYAS